jgi:hypothetical protein
VAAEATERVRHPSSTSWCSGWWNTSRSSTASSWTQWSTVSGSAPPAIRLASVGGRQVHPWGHRGWPHLASCSEGASGRGCRRYCPIPSKHC